MKIKYNFLILLLSISLFSCEAQDSVSQGSSINKTNEELYKDAVNDALVTEENEVYDHLTIISESNNELSWKGESNDRRVLVSTMVPEKYLSSYPAGDTITLKYSECWVTAVPEMKTWFAVHNTRTRDLTLRCEQLLGLPEREGNYYFIEMWVLPADVFRPSPDNEITDDTAEMDFPATADSAYKVWFNNNILSSYFPGPGKYKYPWTRLGYTYDWGDPENEIGLSEFVVKKNARVIIKAATALNEYLR